MKKLILASVSAIALLGVAACSDTDNTKTQSVEPPAQTTVPSDPAMQPAPADQQAPAATDMQPTNETAPTQPAAPAQ